MYLFEEPNVEPNSRFHFCAGPEPVLKINLEPEPESGVFIKVKNRSTLVGYSVPSGKKDRCPPWLCPSGIMGTLVGYLVPSGKKKNLRPMSAMPPPPSQSPFWDKGGKKDACKKKTWITKRN
jgi:hypothetical protein